MRKKWKQAIARTHEAIECDAIAMEEDLGNNYLRNDILNELILDADRIKMFGGLSDVEYAAWKALPGKDKEKLVSEVTRW